MKKLLRNLQKNSVPDTTCYPENSCFEWIHLKKTISTNSYLKEKEQQESGKKFVVVTTDFQISGRGQRGNSWESEKGANLLFSILCRPSSLAAAEQFKLSQIISLSIKEELDNYGKGFSIKWPNDIYWNEKKICGILIEHNLTGNHISESIIGIGININQAFFKSPAPNPVSLAQITGKKQNKEEILVRILTRFERYYQLLEQGKSDSIAQNYFQSLFRKNGFHLYRDKEEEFYACIEAVEPNGCLILTDTENQKRKYAFKEISFIL